MPIRNAEIISFALASFGAALAGYFFYRAIKGKFGKDTPLKKNVSPVFVCNHLADWVSNEKKFLPILQEAKVIGMDCEWVTVDDMRNPVALLQLATADGFCILIRLCNISPWLMPSGLIDLLNDTGITKVGVGVFEDAQKLLVDYGITVRGCLDLRRLVHNVAELKGKGLSLQSLAEALLGVKLKKNITLSCSDWEAEHLTTKQIAYAAEDALAAAQIFQSLTQLENTCVKSIDEDIIDIPFKNISKPVKKGNKIKNYDPDRTTISKKVTGRKKLIYENCQLQAPDGETLCSCDRKKAQWYVDKGRGEVVQENPFIVRLNFEPSARPILDNTYYVQQKKNCCVVCGDMDLFFRKSIVPSEYRRYFPNLMKRNLSHDILLLCVRCHRKSNLLDQKLRHKLAKECNAPIEDGPSNKYRSNQALSSVKSAAKALIKSKDQIPEARRLELERIVKKHFKVQEISKDLLQEACTLVANTKNENHTPHGWKVYQHICKNGGLIQFEARWRQHFLDTMQPKFLPIMWSVNHNHERLALQVTKTKVDFDISILGLDQVMLGKEKLTTKSI